MMVMSVLQAAYPAFYKDFGDGDLNGIVNLWTEMFKDDDLRSVMAATQALISTKVEGYPPTIGAIKERLHMIRTPDEMSDKEAWKLVIKACRNGYYNSVEEFEKLPEVIQRSIGGPEQLKAWSQMDSETVESVVASNFMRTFRVKQGQQKELDMMPTDVKKYMAAIADKMRISAGEKKSLESPKQPALEPVKLSQYTAPKVVEQAEQKPQPSRYKTPSQTDWEKMREEAFAKLSTVKTGESET